MNLVRIQVAIILDELPSKTLAEIEKYPTSYDHIYSSLSGVDLDGYFSKVNDRVEQQEFAAKSIVQFFIERKKI